MRHRLVYSILLVLAVATTLVYNLVLNNNPVNNNDVEIKIYELDGKRVLEITKTINITKHPPEDPFGSTFHELMPDRTSTTGTRSLFCTGVNASCVSFIVEAPRDSNSVRLYVVFRSVYTVSSTSAAFETRQSSSGNPLVFTTGNLTGLTPGQVYEWVVNISSFRYTSQELDLAVHPALVNVDKNFAYTQNIDVSCSIVGTGTTTSVSTSYARTLVNSTHATWWINFDYARFKDAAPVVCTLAGISGYGNVMYFYAKQPLGVNSVVIRIVYVTSPVTPIS